MEQPFAKRQKRSRDDLDSLQEVLSTLRAQFEAVTNLVVARLEAKQNSLEGDPEGSSPNTQLLAGSQDASLLEELDTLKARLAENDEELAGLQSEIEQKTAMLQRQRRQLEEYGLDQMSKQNPLTRTQGPDDDSIHEATQTLYYAIRNLADLDFKGQPLRKPVKAAHKEAFQKLTKEPRGYEDYLLDIRFKAYFVEAVIWDRLIDDLLKTPLAVYLGTSDVEEAVRPRLRANDKDYPAWRAGTGGLLATNPRDYHDAWRLDGSRSVALIERLFGLLIPFHRTGTEKDLRYQLNIIVEKAVNLAGLMSRSRAFWAVSLTSVKRCPTVHNYDDLSHRYGFSVVEDYTKVLRVRETDGQRGKTRVSLIVRPSLLKWGDSSGRNYDVCQVMRQREVVTTAS